MTTKNRQITTNFNQKEQGIILENIKTGKMTTVTKSEARRILATEKTSYRIHMD